MYDGLTAWKFTQLNTAISSKVFFFPSMCNIFREEHLVPHQRWTVIISQYCLHNSHTRCIVFSSSPADGVVACLCVSLCPLLPEPLTEPLSLFPPELPMSFRDKEKVAVSPGSKIYEQLKVGRRPAFISPTCFWQPGWGGLAVNHSLYTFISVFPPKREGYDKIMFYCSCYLERCRHLSRNSPVGGQSPCGREARVEKCVCESPVF